MKSKNPEDMINEMYKLIARTPKPPGDTIILSSRDFKKLHSANWVMNQLPGTWPRLFGMDVIINDTLPDGEVFTIDLPRSDLMLEREIFVTEPIFDLGQKQRQAPCGRIRKLFQYIRNIWHRIYWSDKNRIDKLLSHAGIRKSPLVKYIERWLSK